MNNYVKQYWLCSAGYLNGMWDPNLFVGRGLSAVPKAFLICFLH